MLDLALLGFADLATCICLMQLISQSMNGDSMTTSNEFSMRKRVRMQCPIQCLGPIIPIVCRVCHSGNFPYSNLNAIVSWMLILCRVSRTIPCSTGIPSPRPLVTRGTHAHLFFNLYLLWIRTVITSASFWSSIHSPHDRLTLRPCTSLQRSWPAHSAILGWRRLSGSTSTSFLLYYNIIIDGSVEQVVRSLESWRCITSCCRSTGIAWHEIW
jgi:hypothetical protein